MIQQALTKLGRMPQFAALRHRGFRLLWFATLLSSTARWADMVVIGWLTLELTNSPFWVGIVAGSKMIGYFTAPFMGVIADRVDRRLLMIIAAVVNLGVSVAMLALFALDWLALWHVIALAFVSSLTWSLDHPTRQALMPDLVGKDDLTNAIALNSVAVEITVVIGPALGGLLIPIFGMVGAYALIAAIYLADLAVLFILKPVEHSGPQVRESPGRSMAEGLKYVRGNHTVLVLLVLACLLNFLAAPYRYAFLPVFARDILNTGAAGYGMLTAAAGVGALVAGVWVVSLGNIEGKGRVLVWNCYAWSVSLVLFAFSTWYYASVALVFAAGLAQAICWTFIATLILGHTAQSMRGRVMGLRAGVVSSLPIGNFIGGAIAERAGAPVAQGIYGAACIVTMLVIVAMAPELRRLK